MPKLRQMTAVNVDYATAGPNRNTLRQPINKPAASLFRCLENGPAWKVWLGIDVEWTSPEPFGVGTTRTVTAPRQKIEETFLAWDQGRRMNFRFERSTLPLAAMAEDYLAVSTGDSSCELVWSYAFEWNGPLGSVGSAVFAKLFAFNAKRSLKKLANYLEGTSEFDG